MKTIVAANGSERLVLRDGPSLWVRTPFGPDKPLDLIVAGDPVRSVEGMIAKHGFDPVVGEDGRPDPVVGDDEYPRLERDGEVWRVVERIEGAEWWKDTLPPSPG